MDWLTCDAGASVRNDRACSMDTEVDPAVRDTTGSSRYDGSRSSWRRQDLLYPRTDEGADRVWSSSQGDEDEPEGDHGTADVWSSRRRHQRLDGRHLLDALEKNSQNQKGMLSFQWKNNKIIILTIIATIIVVMTICYPFNYTHRMLRESLWLHWKMLLTVSLVTYITFYVYLGRNDLDLGFKIL